MMINEINDEKLTSQCLKCKTSDTELLKSKWETKLNIKGKKKRVIINFAACKPCMAEIDRFIEIEKSYKRNIKGAIYLFFTVAWMSIIISIMMIFADIKNLNSLYISVPLSIIFMVPPIFLYARMSSHSGNLKKFLNINHNGFISLKNQTDSMEHKIDILEVEKDNIQQIHEETHEFCPNCGSNIKTHTGFCNNCGKNLRN